MSGNSADQRQKIERLATFSQLCKSISAHNCKEVLEKQAIEDFWIHVAHEQPTRFIIWAQQKITVAEKAQEQQSFSKSSAPDNEASNDKADKRLCNENNSFEDTNTPRKASYRAIHGRGDI